MSGTHDDEMQSVNCCYPLSGLTKKHPGSHSQASELCGIPEKHGRYDEDLINQVPILVIVPGCRPFLEDQGIRLFSHRTLVAKNF